MKYSEFKEKIEDWAALLEIPLYDYKAQYNELF